MCQLENFPDGSRDPKLEWPDILGIAAIFSAVILVALGIVYAIANYDKTKWFWFLPFIVLGIFLRKKKMPRYAWVSFVVAGIMLCIPFAISKSHDTPAPISIAKPAESKITKPSPEKPNSAAKVSNLPPLPTPCVTNQETVTGVDEYGIEKPIASARPNGSIPTPCPTAPAIASNTSPAPWPRPENLPLAATQKPASLLEKIGEVFQRDTGVVQAKAQDGTTEPSRGCRTLKDSNVPTFQYGEIMIMLTKCHQSGTQEEFAGTIEYKGLERHLLVFHRFIVSDTAGKKYTVQEGRIGKYDQFGMGHRYQWMESGQPSPDVVEFSFIVGTIDPSSPPALMNLTLPWNQSGEGVNFKEVIERSK